MTFDELKEREGKKPDETEEIYELWTSHGHFPI